MKTKKLLIISTGLIALTISIFAVVRYIKKRNEDKK